MLPEGLQSAFQKAEITHANYPGLQPKELQNKEVSFTSTKRRISVYLREDSK